jgi:guanylate kinase
LEDRLGVKRSISATTRPIRDGEKEGEDYRFLRRKEFQDRIASGGFVEHAQYAGEFYGTPRAPLEAAISRGETVLLSIDVQGARSIRVAFPDAVTIFVRPPSLEEAKRRLMGRHREREAEIDRRMEIACKELECAGEFDYQVVNDDLDTAIDETAKIITRARAGRS